MAVFSVGKPITTTIPTIAVDPGLPVGSHSFQLEVIDSAGNRSRPDVAVVTVQRETITVPTVLDTRPTITAPGPVVTPVVNLTGTTLVTPRGVTPRGPAPRRGPKRSKPK